MIAGTDAGDKIRVWYAIANQEFPILSESVEVLTDTAVGTFGLAWFRGNDDMGTSDPSDDEPRFQVRDDIDVDQMPYVPFHEAGHAFAETVARYIAQSRGVSWLDVFDEIRERYWSMRGFPGTWQEAQDKAINGGGWFYYPDESFADCFAHAMLFLRPVPGYVTGEWTNNFGTTPIWQTPDKAVNFMRQLMSEAQGGDMAFKDDPDAIAYKEDVRLTLEAIKAELARQAHHTHSIKDETVAIFPPRKTGEPETA